MLAFRTTRVVTYSIGLIVLAPLYPFLVTHLQSDQLRLNSDDDPLVAYRILIAAYLCMSSFVLDLFTRPTLHWSTLTHHVVACVMGTLACDWNVGFEMGVFHLIAGLLEFASDYTFVVVGVSKDPGVRVRWLAIGKLWFAVVKSVAQVSILMILSRMMRARMENGEDFLSLQLVPVLVLLLDMLLVWTQLLFVQSLTTRQCQEQRKTHCFFHFLVKYTVYWWLRAVTCSFGSFRALSSAWSFTAKLSTGHLRLRSMTQLQHTYGNVAQALGMACRASLSITRQRLPTVKWVILNSPRATHKEMTAHQFRHGLTVFMATFIGTALVFRTVQAIIKRGYLVDPSASNAKKYVIIFRLTRLITYSIGLLALMPALPTMIAYLLSGQLRITISQPFIPYRILTAASICVASLVLDLFARPTLRMSTLLHHVAACAIGVLISDWNIGLEIGLFHLLASLLEIPTDLALVVEGVSFDRITPTLWLEFGKWWFAIVKFLAQVPVLMIIRHMLRASIETEGFVGRSVVLLVTVLLDGVLLWTHVLFFRSLEAKQCPKTTE